MAEHAARLHGQAQLPFRHTPCCPCPNANAITSPPKPAVPWLQADAGGAGDEPEVRRALRQRRIQEKHERMMRQVGAAGPACACVPSLCCGQTPMHWAAGTAELCRRAMLTPSMHADVALLARRPGRQASPHCPVLQLAEKRARDEAEAAEKSGKVELRSALKPKIDAWSAGKKDNIRALLASLHTVLWEDSGWTPPSMADMVEPGKVGPLLSGVHARAARGLKGAAGPPPPLQRSQARPA